MLTALSQENPLADLRGGGLPGTRVPPRSPNSIIFMQFLAKKWQNNSTYGSWRPLLGEILDPPLESTEIHADFLNKHCKDGPVTREKTYIEKKTISPLGIEIHI